MGNLRALSLTCVRVQLPTAGADVCDIMESLSIPELFFREKSRSLPSPHQEKLSTAMRPKEYSMLRPNPASTRDSTPSTPPACRS